jgi:hypothetical protein
MRLYNHHVLGERRMKQQENDNAKKTAEEIEAQWEQQSRTELWAWMYAKARERIKAKGGMLTTDEALEQVRKEDLPQHFRDAIDELEKINPVLWYRWTKQKPPNLAEIEEEK